MATKSYYLTNTLGDGWCTMSESTQAAATTGTGWVVSTGATLHSELEANVERAATTFTGTTVPDGTLDTTLKDAFRINGPITGSFASANWDWHFVVRAVTVGGAQDGRVRFRLIKADANGANATEITSGQQQAVAVSNVSTSADFDCTSTFNPGVFTITNQHLFIQIAWERTGAGGMTTSDILFRTGSSSSAGTRITTSNFTQTTLKALAVTGASVPTLRRAIRTSKSVTAPGVATVNKRTAHAMGLVLGRAIPAMAQARFYSKQLAVIAASVPTMARKALKVAAVTGRGAPTLSKAIRVSRAVTGAGVPTLQRKVGKVLGVTGAGTPTLSRRIGKGLSVVSGGVVTLARSTRKALATVGAGVASMAQQFIPAGGGGELFEQTLSVTAAAVPSMRRGIARSLSVTAAVIPAIRKGIRKVLGVLGRAIPALSNQVVSTPPIPGTLTVGYRARLSIRLGTRNGAGTHLGAGNLVGDTLSTGAGEASDLEAGSGEAAEMTTGSG